MKSQISKIPPFSPHGVFILQRIVKSAFAEKEDGNAFVSVTGG